MRSLLPASPRYVSLLSIRLRSESLQSKGGCVEGPCKPMPVEVSGTERTFASLQ